MVLGQCSCPYIVRRKDLKHVQMLEEEITYFWRVKGDLNTLFMNWNTQNVERCQFSPQSHQDSLSNDNQNHKSIFLELQTWY